MTVYVNATRRGTLELSGPIVSGGSSLYLGASSGAYDWLNADLDEVAVYGQALSARRVAAHFAAADVPPTSPTVSLDSPADGSTFDDTPTYGGLAATEPGSADTVTVSVYPGTEASGTPAQVADRGGPARGHVLGGGLAGACRAARTRRRRSRPARPARQAGLSPARTFTVDAGLPPTVLAAGDIAGCDTSGDEATAALLDRLPGTVVDARRPCLRVQHRLGVRELLRPDLGPPQGAHAARRRATTSTDTPAPRRTTLLRRRRRRPGQGLLQLRPRRVARHRAEPRAAPRSAAAARARRRSSGCAPTSRRTQRLHARLLAPSALQLRGRRTAATPHDAALLAGALRLRRRGRAQRARPQLRALRPADAGRRRRRAQGIRQFVVGTGGRSHYALRPPSSRTARRATPTRSACSS